MRVTIVLVLLVAFASPRPVAAEESPELKARTHFAAGEYKEALDIYARLYAETLHPTYLRNIARCHQNLGDPDKAISSFREYLRKAKDLPADQRAEIEGYIAEMEQLKRSDGRARPRRRRPPRRRPPNRPGPGRPGDGDRGRLGAMTKADPFYTRVWFWAVVARRRHRRRRGVYVLTADRSATHGSLGVLDLTD